MQVFRQLVPLARLFTVEVSYITYLATDVLFNGWRRPFLIEDPS